MSKYSRLHEHEFKKGKFLSPFNKALGEKGNLQSWFHERLPEYLWIVIIIEKYGRSEGFKRLFQIISKLVEIAPLIKRPSWFSILKMPETTQLKFYNELEKIVDKNLLSPLTIVHQHSSHPVFATFFGDCQQTPEERTAIIVDCLHIAANHQSDLATDVRYIVLYHCMICGSLAPDNIGFLTKYPEFDHEDEKMRTLRPLVRAAEMTIKGMEFSEQQGTTEDFLDEIMISFWDIISRCADCQLFLIKRDCETSKTDSYIASLQEVFRYLAELFAATRPLDSKMLVVLGISTYAYKRMYEVYAHELYNAIAGRSAIRCIIECYIMLKYLILIEHDHENIWEEYQYYGIGQTKLVVARSRESSLDLTNSHIDYNYLNIIVNHYMNEEFIDMDTSYFDKKNIREKAIAVDEKELFGLYYDYDSHFEHGLWGAIRESSMLLCNSSAHQFHCVPDVLMSQGLPGVWHDCMSVMSKILIVLDDLYGIPKELLAKVQDA